LKDSAKFRFPFEATLAGHDPDQPGRLAAEDAEFRVAGGRTLEEQRGRYRAGCLEDLKGQPSAEDELRRDIPAASADRLRDDALRDVGWPARARQAAEHLRAGIYDTEALDHEALQHRQGEGTGPAVVETTLAEKAGTTEKCQGFGFGFHILKTLIKSPLGGKQVEREFILARVAASVHGLAQKGPVKISVVRHPEGDSDAIRRNAISVIPKKFRDGPAELIKLNPAGATRISVGPDAAAAGHVQYLAPQVFMLGYPGISTLGGELGIEVQATDFICFSHFFPPEYNINCGDFAVKVGALKI